MDSSSAFLRHALLSIVLLVPPAVLAGCAQEQGNTASDGTADTAGVTLSGSPSIAADSMALESDVPFVESPQPVVNKMLEVANVTENDTLYDLGSGDGRIPITAARKYGAHGVGIEIKPDLVKRARQNAKDAGVSDLVEFRQGDLFEADISDATVVTLYLLPSVNLELRSKLFRQLEPGTRVVSHDFDMDEWEPDTTWKSGGDTVYRWTIPEEIPAFVDTSSSGS
ncbi:MAG: cyclopropane-fatty-acyl-phospholipid synthase family protein [Salinibacter sp.]